MPRGYKNLPIAPKPCVECGGPACMNPRTRAYANNRCVECDKSIVQAKYNPTAEDIEAATAQIREMLTDRELAARAPHLRPTGWQPQTVRAPVFTGKPI